MENDLPIKIGSKILPNKTWTPVIESTKKNKVLVGSSCTKAKSDNKITETNEPTICTKLMIKANNPQNIGKFTSKNTQAKPVPMPVRALTNIFPL